MNNRPKILRFALFLVGISCSGIAVSESVPTRYDVPIDCPAGVCAQAKFNEIDILTLVVWGGKLLIGLDMPKTFVPFRAIEANTWLASSKHETLGGILGEYEFSQEDRVALFHPDSFKLKKKGKPIIGYVLTPYDGDLNAKIKKIIDNYEARPSDWYVALGSTSAQPISSAKILNQWRDKNSAWDKKLWTTTTVAWEPNKP